MGAAPRHDMWDRDKCICGYKWKMVLCSPKASFELAGERVCVYAGHKEMNIYLSTEEPFFYENCILLVLRELSLFAFQPSEC